MALELTAAGQHRLKIQITHLIDEHEIDQASRTIFVGPDIDIFDVLKAVAGGTLKKSAERNGAIAKPMPPLVLNAPEILQPPATALRTPGTPPPPHRHPGALMNENTFQQVQRRRSESKAKNTHYRGNAMRSQYLRKAVFDWQLCKKHKG